MQANTPTANSSYDSGIAQSIDALVDTVTDALESVDADSETIDAVEEHGEQVAEAADDEIEELRTEIENNQDEIEAVDESHGENIAGCHSRINSVEDEIDDLEPTDASAADSSGDNPKGESEETTALERVCALPEHVVEDNLTANQRRARSVARRIEEYGRKVPAGIGITSSRIRRVLTAQEDTTIHRQTVSRVADFLERFGDGQVKIKETKGGKTTVVFDEEIVDAVTAVVTDNTDAGVTPAVV